MNRSRLLVAAIIIILFCQAAYSVDPVDPVVFDMYFTRFGNTEINFCYYDGTNFDKSTAITRIEFPLWRQNVSTDRPMAYFGISWKIYVDTNYTINLSFNSKIDWSSDSMLSAISADGTVEADLNFSLFEHDVKTSNNNAVKELSSDSRSLTINGGRTPYTEVSGTAKIGIIMDEILDGDNKLNYIGGYYSGYAKVELRTY